MSDEKRARQRITAPGVPTPPLHYSPAVKCGSWVFLAGMTATDWKSGLAPEAVLPHLGNSARVEIRHLYKNLLALAQATGASIPDVVRIDSFYTDSPVRGGHFSARDEFWGERATDKFASTGVEMTRFLPTGARMMMDAIAVLPEDGKAPDRIWEEAIGGSPISIPMAVRYGDFVFVSGRMAYDPPEDGLSFRVAVRAQTVNGLWPSTFPDARSQTRFLLTEKLGPILEKSGASLADVVKAQVYLLTPDDITFVDEAWEEVFPTDPPAKTITIVNRMALQGGVVEINLIALRSDGATKKETIRAADLPEPLFYEPLAVKAGPLLFLSTQLAADEGGLAKEVRKHPDFPFNVSSGQVQMEVILRNVGRICAAAGGSVEDVVKVQSYFTDLGEFSGAHRAWKDTFTGDVPPAWTIAQVDGPLPVAGAVVLCDVIAYVGSSPG